MISFSILPHGKRKVRYVRRGMDPRDFALMSFGGAGGLHANAVARELEIPTAIIPAMASVLSALRQNDDAASFGACLRDPAGNGVELPSMSCRVASAARCAATSCGYTRPAPMTTPALVECAARQATSRPAAVVEDAEQGAGFRGVHRFPCLRRGR